MPWRYQPVIETDNQGDQVSLCEVYFDDQGKLENWTEHAGMTPCGETIDELTASLIQMLTDAMAWVPVNFSDLRVGMTFEKAITMEQRNEIADMIEAWDGAAKNARKLVN